MRRAVRRLTTGLALTGAVTAITAAGAAAAAQGGTQLHRGRAAIAARIRRLPGPITSLRGISCASATVCYATGIVPRHGAAVVTIRSGVPSQAKLLGRGQGGPDADLTAISCAGSSCEAIGADSSQAPFAVALTGGRPGPIQSLGTSQIALTSIACAAPGACLAGGSVSAGGFATTALALPFSSGQPATPQTIVHEIDLNSIACPMATICEALAATSLTREDLYEISVGGNLLRPPTSFGSLVPAAIACGSASTCAAVGDYAIHPPYRAGVVTITNGVPGKPQRARNATGLSAISCPTAEVCEAVGYVERSISHYVGLILTVHGGLPGKPTLLPFQPSAIDCPTATTCVAVGNSTRRPYDAYVDTIRLPQLSGGGGHRF